MATEKFPAPTPLQSIHDIRKIFNSIYFHQHPIDDTPWFAQWLSDSMRGKDFLVFFREPRDLSAAAYSTTNTSGLEGNITMVTIYSSAMVTIYSSRSGANQSILTETHIPFYCSFDQERLCLFFKNNVYADLRSLCGKPSALLFNLMLKNTLIDEHATLTFKEISAIKDKDLLNNEGACKKARVRKTPSREFSAIESIELNRGIGLIHTISGQFIIVSVKQLRALYEYSRNPIQKNIDNGIQKELNNLEVEAISLKTIKHHLNKGLTKTEVKECIESMTDNTENDQNALTIQLLNAICSDTLMGEEQRQAATLTIERWSSHIEKTRKILEKIQNGKLVDTNWGADLHDVQSPSVQRIIAKWGASLHPFRDIKQISGSVYFHTYIDIDNNDRPLLQWIADVIPPQTCLIFFKYLSSNSRVQTPATISTSDAGHVRINDRLTFISIISIISNKQKKIEIDKSSVPFSYPLAENKFQLIFRNPNEKQEKFFGTLDDVMEKSRFVPLRKNLKEFKTTNPEGKIIHLFNLIPGEKINTQPTLLTEDINTIKQLINDKDLLKNPEACKKAIITNWWKLKPSPIASIHHHSELGLCLIQTVDGQFAMLSAEQLIALREYALQAQETTQPLTTPFFGSLFYPTETGTDEGDKGLSYSWKRVGDYSSNLEEESGSSSLKYPKTTDSGSLFYPGGEKKDSSHAEKRSLEESSTSTYILRRPL